jgi:hypothetical protein
LSIREKIHAPEYSYEERRRAHLNLAKSPRFLILGLNADFGGADNPIPKHVCTWPWGTIRVVKLVSKEERESWPRFLLEFEERKPKSAKAIKVEAHRITSAIENLFTHTHHSVYDEFAPYQVPKAFADETIAVETLEYLDRLVGDDFVGDFITQRLGSCIGIPNSSLATIFYLLPFAISDEDLFNACSFFRSCCADYSLMDTVVREILKDPKRGPDGERERLALENVILQSLRTIEALVGEPGGNELRFRKALQARGLDYDDRVGFQRKRKRNKLGDRILWLQRARDSAAAHGKRRRGAPFTLFEAMEAQNLADTVLHTSLWFAAESKGRTGNDDELRFLLTELFRGFHGRDWVGDKSLFGGNTAIDLARMPGGLKKVVKAHEREWAEAAQPRSSRKGMGAQKISLLAP